MLKTYGYIATHTHDNALLVEQDVKLLDTLQLVHTVLSPFPEHLKSNRVLGFESEPRGLESESSGFESSK